jgi:hypothetical protein
MPANRRTIVLAAGLGVAVLVVALIWTSGGSSATSTSSVPPRAAAPGAQQQAGPQPGTMTAVNLEALTAPRAEPVDATRNPFRFQQRQAPPPSSAGPSGRGGLPPPPPVNQTPVFTPPMPTGPPPPPPIPLKFIGIVMQGKKRVAVLTDGKSGPQSGEEGAIILGQYQILKIGNESIEMAYFDGRGRQTIRMTGQ